MIRILYAGSDRDWVGYKTILLQKLRDSGIEARLDCDPSDPETVDYIIYSQTGPLEDFAPFSNAKLVQNLWAGVDTIAKNKSLGIPLARMVEFGLTQGMADYVTGHVLRHMLRIDEQSHAAIGDWNDIPPPLSTDTNVAVLGLGELGLYCGRKLAQFGFQVCGWSRTQKKDDLIDCYSGETGLQTVLARADIVILLMPDTPQTQNIINSKRLAQMKQGASIINPGRGPLIDDAALIAALNSGQISQATLDVFRQEPLPKDNPFWTHPNVLITPHIASATRVNTSCDTIVENIKRGEAGKPFLYLVDRKAGY